MNRKEVAPFQEWELFFLEIRFSEMDFILKWNDWGSFLFGVLGLVCEK